MKKVTYKIVNAKTGDILKCGFETKDEALDFAREKKLDRFFPKGCKESTISVLPEINY